MHDIEELAFEKLAEMRAIEILEELEKTALTAETVGRAGQARRRRQMAYMEQAHKEGRGLQSRPESKRTSSLWRKHQGYEKGAPSYVTGKHQSKVHELMTRPMKEDILKSKLKRSLKAGHPVRPLPEPARKAGKLRKAKKLLKLVRGR